MRPRGLVDSAVPLRDPALALDAVAKPRRAGTARIHARGDARRLALREARALVIDNAEHLLPQVATISRGSARRRAEAARDEQGAAAAAGRARMVVPSLDDHDGPALFTARARALRPDSGDACVGELCARLDNLPLALELAARVPIFSPEQLLERLGHGVELRKAGATRTPPADPRRDDPLVVRPPRAGRAAAVRAPCGVRGRLHVRGGRGRVRRRTPTRCSR